MKRPTRPVHHASACAAIFAALVLSACIVGEPTTGESTATATSEVAATETATAAATETTPTPAATEHAATPAATATAPPSPTATATPTATTRAPTGARKPEITEYPVPAGAHPHDVAPAPDGSVWYTAQRQGALGRLDPATGATRHIPLGAGSSPHGVIVGPNGAAWVTDSGLNAIVRVDPRSEAVTVYPLPADRPNANLNTAAFDRHGVLWFTGQNGIYGWFDPATRRMKVFDSPRGRGPYGIAATPDGDIYYASLAGSYVGAVDIGTGEVKVLDPPSPGQGARRVWSDSRGRIWVSEWNSGQLSRYDPRTRDWQEWRLPGDRPQAYAVFVDDRDLVWVTDLGANAIVRFDPKSEQFEVFALPTANAQVRQLLGRPGELWGAESATDRLVVIRY